MALRKWVVRSVVFALLALLTAAGFAYHYWTNPVIVRQQVLARLRQHLPDADITLESAGLSLFGGIPFSDLRLMERGDPAHSEVAHIPSGTIYYDKERLHKKQLLISKIDWYRPTLHIIRHANGSWNIARVLPRTDPSQPVPIIQLQHATVFFEDQQFPTGLAALEIRDVNLKIINDPLPILTFSGSGLSEMLGKVELRPCTLDRRTNALALALGLPDIPVDRTLLKRISAYLPEAVERAGNFSARASVDARVNYQPRSPQPWSHQVHCRIRQGRLQRPDLPLPLDNLEAETHCIDSLLTLDSLTARAGDARLVLHGRMLGCSDSADLEGSLRVEHLAVTPELLAALPDALRHCEADYRPRGIVSLAIDFRRQQDQWRQHCIIRPEDLRILCSKFPYALERITGIIEHELDAASGKDTKKLMLTGYTGSQPVHLEAVIRGQHPAAMEMHIWGRDIPLDAKLQNALKPEYQRLVQDFSPRGLGDFDAYLTRAGGEPDPKKRFLIRFHDAEMKFQPFPYPLENVSGFLDIEPDHWEFRDFHGSHKGGDFYSHGSSDRQAHNGFTATITGKNVLLDQEIQAAVQQEGLKRAWVNLTPAGRMNFEAQVVKRPKSDPDVDVKVTALGCSFRPGFFPYGLNDVRGLIHYHQGQIELTRLSARHDLSRLSLESGKVYLKPTGGLTVNLFTISGDPLVPDEEFLAAMPSLMRQACTSLQLRDPMTLLVHLLIDLPADPGSPPHVYWDGGIRLQDARLCAGVPLDALSGQIWCRGEHWGHFGDVRGYIEVTDVTVLGQHFHNLQTPLAVSAAKPYQLELPDVRTRLFGGDVVGRMHVEFHPLLRYEVNLSGSDLQLEEFAQVNDLGARASMSGLATARLFLTGQGSDFKTVEGGGSIDVPNGKIYNNLPLLLDLIKVLNLRAPDRTAFEEAHVRFDLHGERVQFNQLELIGNAISLSGKGSMSIKGTDLNLDFYPLWGRIMQWSPPGLDRIPPLISQSLLKIKMRGSLAQRQTTRELVPPVVEPVKGLLRSMTGRKPLPSPPKRGRGERCSISGRGEVVFISILFRSIFAELAKIFVLALIGITGIIVLAGIVVEATQRGLGPAQILTAIPLLVPSLLPFIIPPTTLFTACVVYGRLSHDNEIIAIKSAGVNVLRVVWPGALLGLIMSLLTVSLYYYLIPYTHHLMRSLATKDLEDFLYTLLKTDREISNRPNLKLNYEMWVERVDGRRLHNAVFKRRGPDGKFDVVAFAREAELHVHMERGEHGEVEVHMHNGRVLDQRSDGLYFEDHTWNVPLNPVGDVKLSPRDMTWRELLENRRLAIGEIEAARSELAQFALLVAQQSLTAPPGELDRMKQYYENHVRQKEQRLAGLNTELCMRPALAFGCLFFVLVGCPVGIWFSKSDYLSAFITCFLPIVFLYYPLQLCATNLAKDGRLPPILALWAANVAMAAMALPLFHKLLKN